MKNKKGFTLIELLAVIIILAIIALIATPITLNIMKKVRRAAFKISVENIVSTIDSKYNIGLLYDEIKEEKVYNFTTKDKIDTLGLMGKVPTEGEMILTKLGKVSVDVNDGEFCAVKDFTDAEVRVGDYLDGICELKKEETKDELDESLEDTCFIFDTTTGTILGLKDDSRCDQKNIVIPTTISNVKVLEIADSAFAQKTDFDAYLVGTGDRWGVHSYEDFEEKIYDKNEYDISQLPEDAEYIYKISYIDGVTPEYGSDFNNKNISEDCYFSNDWDRWCVNPETYDSRLGYIETVDFTNAKYLQRIGKYAFLRNKLSGELNLSGLTQLTTIDDGAFERNYITSLNLSDATDLRIIGEDAFFKNNIESINANNVTKLTIINDSSFAHNSLKGELDLSKNKGIMKIDKSAFSRNQISSVNLSGIDQLVSIEEDAFFYNIIEKVSFDGLINLTYIGENAFSKNIITKVDLSGCINLETIGKNAFFKNTITELNIDNLSKLKSIGDYAFNTNIIESSIDFASLTSLETIGNYAFSYNPIQGSVTIKNNQNLKKIGNSVFRGTNINKVELIDLPNLSEIGTFAFSYVNWIDNLIISNTPKLLEIKEGTFLNSLNVDTFTIPDSVETIGKDAFYASTINGTLIISDNVKTIGYNAFYYSTINNLIIGSGVKTIGYEAFSYSDISSISIKGKTSLSDFDSIPSSKPFGSYDVNKIVWIN